MAKRKAKKSETIYQVELYAAYPTELNGDILEENDKYVVLRHKRPRSSKRVRTVFYKNDPIREIIAIYGQVGGAGALLYMEPSHRVERRTGTIEYSDDGWLILHPENGGESFKFNPKTAHVSGDDEEANQKAKSDRQKNKQQQSKGSSKKEAASGSGKGKKGRPKKNKSDW